jgi:molybdopterin/thiamine biosynthesis adenylyltransferase
MLFVSRRRGLAMLSPREMERYDRQIMIQEIGKGGQIRLKRSKVFVAGAGGLGSPISMYLVAAGIGSLKIVDHDRVELSNLNRQILHWDEDIQKKKVDSALEKLRKLNTSVSIEVLEETITEQNVLNLVADCDGIVDAMDNLPARYVLNKAALHRKIPFFHGAVRGFEGRAMTVVPGESACLRCLYRGPVPQEKFPVIGVTPAVVGCIQATEVIKWIVGIGELLTNRLLLYDGLNMRFTEFNVERNPQCEHCGQESRKG